MSFAFIRRRVRALGAALLGAVCGCEASPAAPPPEQLAAPWQSQVKLADAAGPYAERAAPLVPGAKHVLWFGHSLLITEAGWPAPGDPALDLPGLVAELHEAARADGRTQIPRGRSLTFAEGPYDASYWLDGAGRARDKLDAVRDVPWTHVVEVDLIHLLGQERFDRPDLYEWLSKLSISEGSVRTRTRNVYRFMGMTHALLPTATWVNYVAPALANNPAVQPAIDARFACIREQGRALGLTVVDAPVGRAFREAEAEAAGRGLTLQLRHDDFLHLRPQGALLAAAVLYASVYDVDPAGLPPPARYRGKLGGTPEQEAEVAMFLGEIASRTWRSYRSVCAPDAAVREDGAAAAWLARATQARTW